MTLQIIFPIYFRHEPTSLWNYFEYVSLRSITGCSLRVSEPVYLRNHHFQHYTAVLSGLFSDNNFKDRFENESQWISPCNSPIEINGLSERHSLISHEFGIFQLSHLYLVRCIYCMYSRHCPSRCSVLYTECIHSVCLSDTLKVFHDQHRTTSSTTQLH